MFIITFITCYPPRHVEAGNLTASTVGDLERIWEEIARELRGHHEVLIAGSALHCALKFFTAPLEVIHKRGRVADKRFDVGKVVMIGDPLGLLFCIFLLCFGRLGLGRLVFLEHPRRDGALQQRVLAGVL